jgi:hypothetical protein
MAVASSTEHRSRIFKEQDDASTVISVQPDSRDIE